MTQKLTINAVEVSLSNLEKTYCPEGNITKKDCINYYIRVYPYIKSHLENRPISLTRYPNGFNMPGFYQKNAPQGKPHWVKTIGIKNIEDYPLINNMETFLWLCNLGTIEFHPWLSNINSIESPDYGVFDIDPMEKFGFKEVVEIAQKIHDVLELLKIQGYPKLSGSTGMQIFVPLDNIYTYKEVREFIRLVYVIVHNQLPLTTTMTRKVNDREGKIYLDYLQNAKGQTIVAPYSIRPKKNAPISVPVTWEDVYKENLSAQKYNIKNSIEKIECTADHFKQVILNKQNINKAYNILENIIL
ncbi:DNA polymerase domain-containing protein [Alkalicella caledoniensis]|uniref:DNA polymerase domain-containing protein n=1 Tax=Alkalicella caledoniensis TaxID=2731377 RepID=A0A7G9W8H6_ALKCA|nr:non-homologous end-joining DNA ligase [Alkalicella caledoniensis]QNO14988.1 DNA polymerase domain-containing protein [Alkalicella caledoniensis]